MMDVDIAIESIRFLNAERLFDVEVTFLVESKLGEMRFHIQVEQADNLHGAVERARRQLDQFADGLHRAAQTPFFQPTS